MNDPALGSGGAPRRRRVGAALIVSLVGHVVLLLSLTRFDPPHRETLGQSGTGSGGNSIVDVGLINSPTTSLDSPSPGEVGETEKEPEPPKPKVARRSRNTPEAQKPKEKADSEFKAEANSESESDSSTSPDSGKEKPASRKPLVARGDGASAPNGDGVGMGSGGTPDGQPGENDDRIRGTMIIKCVLSRAGSLESCRVIKPLPRVADAVMDALHKWRLSPWLLDDQDPTVDYVIPIKLVFPNR
jgi:protein TonB